MYKDLKLSFNLHKPTGKYFFIFEFTQHTVLYKQMKFGFKRIKNV